MIAMNEGSVPKGVDFSFVGDAEEKGFSYLRNQVILKAIQDMPAYKNNWLLFLDSDDDIIDFRLKYPMYKDLCNELQAYSKIDALSVPITSPYPAEHVRNSMVRLLRVRSGMPKYCGLVHETIKDGLVLDYKPIKDLPPILHHGYEDTNGNKDKVLRNRRLLCREIDLLNSGQQIGLRDFGSVYYDIGRSYIGYDLEMQVQHYHLALMHGVNERVEGLIYKTLYTHLYMEKHER